MSHRRKHDCCDNDNILGEGLCGLSPCCILIALAIFFSGRNRC